MALSEGMYVPIRNEAGLIQGLQIRLDSTKNGNKYKWFSSRFRENGAGARAWLHTVNWDNGKNIFITEGGLKADIAAYFNPDVCYVGLSGVHCQSGIVPLLERMGVKTAVEALDMDKLSNINVTNAATELKRKLFDAGISCESFTWDTSFKGLDDYYQFCNYLDTAA